MSVERECSDDQNLSLVLGSDPLGSSKFCTIFFTLGDFTFPGNGWTDFSYLAEAWLENLADLERNGSCELWFADGPYQVNITADGDQYIFDFIERTASGDSRQQLAVLSRERSIVNLVASLETWEAERRQG
jgi:hypothetical protein